MTPTGPNERQAPDDRASDLAIIPPADASPITEPSVNAALAATGPTGLAESILRQKRESRSRLSQQRRLGRTKRGGRVSRRDAIAALVAEQDLIGQQRDPTKATHGETVVHSLGTAGGNAELGRTQRKLEIMARKSDGLKVRQAVLVVRAGLRLGDHIRHPVGGYRTIAEAQDDEKALRGSIAADIEQGSRRHHRLPPWLRRIPGLVALADFFILLYFFAGVTDVDWSRPLSASLAFALVIGALVTGVAYSFFALTGNRMRSYKDDSGAVPLNELDRLTKIAAGASAGGIVILGALMFTRMRAEVLDALGQHAGATAIVIALALAVVSLLANGLVILVHAVDGSEQVDQLEALGAAVHASLSRAHRQQERAAAYGPKIAALAREAERAAGKAITAAGRHRAVADQIIDVARTVHQGAGPHSEPTIDPNEKPNVIGYRHPDAMPEVDERPLHQALEHIDGSLSDRSTHSSNLPQE